MKLALRQYWALLDNYLRPQWPRALLLAILLLTHISLSLLNPQIVRFFIDTAISGGNLETLINAGLLFIGVALASQVFSILTTYVGEDVAWTATNNLRFDLAKHCLELDQSFHKSHTSGELIERLDGDVSGLSNFFSQMVIHVLGNLILLVGVLVLLFLEDWRVGLGLSSFALVALFVLIRVRTVAIPHWSRVREMNAALFGFLSELFGGTEDIRANGARAYVMHRFFRLVRTWLPIEIKAGLMGSTMWMTATGIFALGNATAFAVSAYLWRLGAVTIGTVYLIFHYAELLRRPIERIRDQIENLQHAEASIKRIKELLAIRSRLQEGIGVPLPSGALSVDLRGVSFGYDEQKTNLHNVTFYLQPGQVLGLLGRTGSGKTTLARLMLRLYDPDRGEIRLGGVALPTVNLKDVRRHVGMVTQEVQLFQATARDNLIFFDSAISDDRLLDVLNDLGLGEWLRSLPAGLDSELKSGGSNLSAGQAQLLAFARVFLANPSLVILDEASSRLDSATEQLIERAVDKLLCNRTAIIIAHRLATVQRADQVMILEDGHILEYGPRSQLASDPDSHFHHLLQTGLEEVLA